MTVGAGLRTVKSYSSWINCTDQMACTSDPFSCSNSASRITFQGVGWVGKVIGKRGRGASDLGCTATARLTTAVCGYLATASIVVDLLPEFAWLMTQ